MRNIPNLTQLRRGKPGYTTRYRIDANHPLHNDPLVDLRELGFADASSYYARPGKLPDDIRQKIPNTPLVRLDVAKRLVVADRFLRTDPEVRRLLGAPARLRIDDALRPYPVQKFAYEVAWPAAIKLEHPEMTDEEIAKHVPHYCAKPDIRAPGPHMTGGAVDVALLNADTGEAFDMGHRAGGVAGTAFPDFYEGYHLTKGQSDIKTSPDQTNTAPEDSQIVRSRRVLYYAMTEVAGFSSHPNEFWHFDIGNTLWAYVSGSHHPYYDLPKLPKEVEAKLAKLQSTLR